MVAAVFPVLGIDVRYVQARYLDPGDRGKYANPSASLGDNPRVAFVRTPHVRSCGIVVVREGLSDAYGSAANGQVTAALLGATCVDSAVADELQRFAAGRPIELRLDEDDAGQLGSQRLLRLLDRPHAVLQMGADFGRG